MKRRDLMKQLSQIAGERGEDLVATEGANHTKVTIGGKRTVVPRHNEVNELTARGILKHMRSK